MGWVVYRVKSGELHRYYATAQVARGQTTRWNRDGYTARLRGELACCSYRDYEGVLMGLRGDALRMWQFCNTKIG